MRWLKHMADTRHDEKVAALIAKTGHAGYGLWWMVLETVARGMDRNSPKCSATYPLSKWAAEFDVLPQNVMRQLKPLAEVGLIQMVLHPHCKPAASLLHPPREGRSSTAVASQYASSRVAVLELSVPNLLKYRDEYSQRSGHSPDSVGTKKQIQNTDTDTDTETPPTPPSPNGSGNHAPASAPKVRKPPETPPEIREWFDSQFWPMYPRHKAKPAALKAVCRKAITEAIREQMMRALAEQLPELRTREAKHVPYPASWINGERWTDELDPEPLLFHKETAAERASRLYDEDIERERLESSS